MQLGEAILILNEQRVIKLIITSHNEECNKTLVVYDPT
jgi:hypothetical protein